VFLLGNAYLENGNKRKTIELYSKTIQAIANDQQAKNQLQNEIFKLESR
jgi:hypothetical protein